MDKRRIYKVPPAMNVARFIAVVYPGFRVIGCLTVRARFCKNFTAKPFLLTMPTNFNRHAHSLVCTTKNHTGSALALLLMDYKTC